MPRTDSLQAGHVFTNVAPSDRVMMQLSFSTADVERQIFYGQRVGPAATVQEGGDVKLLVVHGDVYRLEDKADLPQGEAKPLAEGAGVFRIVGLDESETPAA